MRYLVLLSLLTSVIASLPYNVYVNGSSDNATSFDPAKPCGDIESPCETFDGGLEAAALLKLSERKPITILVAEGYYVHNSSTIGCFQDVSDLSIIGEANDSSSVIVECDEGAGFRFIRCNNIKISLMTFKNCSQLQNSTSYNFQSDNRQFVQFKVGLYFLYCYNVNLTSITVGESAATGIVLYNVAGTNILDGLNIKGNKFDSSGQGGGVYIEYSYCVPSEGDSSGSDCLYSNEWNPNVDVFYIHDAKFYITNCHFVNNIAHATHESFISAFILPHQQYHDALGRGGGLSVFVKGSASNNHIIVDSCVFKNNSALWGGGIFIEFQDTSNNNLLLVRSSELKNNEVYSTTKTYQQTGGGDTRQTGGGGTRIGYVFFDHISYSNNVTFSKSNFTSNKAYNGGGISLYSARYSNYTNTFQLKECYFELNHAMIGGSALDLSLWHSSLSGAHIKPVIKNCTFANHKNHKQIVVGTVYVDSLPVSFGGDTFFIDNDGSALAVTGSYINIEKFSSVTFIRNRGRNGGAIALFGNTFILTNEDSHLTFINNTAQYKGGAIYFYSSGERDLISSSNCFIRFNNLTATPYNWTSKFRFENNVIQVKDPDNNYQRNSIYASSLLSCIWGGGYGNSSYGSEVLNDVFCWNKKNWKYEPHVDSYPCKGHISSAPTTYGINDELNYQTMPGQGIELELKVYDDLNQTVSENSIFIARIPDNNPATFHGENKFDIFSHRYLNINGQPESNVTVILETEDPIVIQKMINIEFLNCPPGYKQPLDYNYSNFDFDNFSCECSNSSYRGYIQCGSDFTSKIIRNGWFGLLNDCDFVVGDTPYFYSNDFNGYVTLYNGSTEYLEQLFCSSLNRTGVLCGTCKNGTGVAIVSDTYECVECNYDYLTVYLLVTYLPITIFFILIFMFSVTVTRGPLNSFIFFAQVISTTIEIDADGSIPLHFVTGSRTFYIVLEQMYKIPYSIWNMNFFRELVGKFCFNPNWNNTLDVMLLSYVEALYPLLLLIVIVTIMVMYGKGVKIIVFIFRPLHYCMARIRQWTNLHQSITGGIAVFIVISYTKFTLISMLLLSPIPLYDYTGNVTYFVYYYNGDILWPQYKYLIPALIVLSIFGVIPPFLLMYSSLLRLIERLSCWRLKLEKLYPPLNLKIFLDEFHGCYRDGSDGGIDCRWFAGLYFILRLILFAIYAATPTWELQYILQILLFLVVAFLFAIIRPYKSDWINKLDASFFIILTAISSLSMYNLMLTWNSTNPNKSIFAIQYVLILIPLLYCIGYYFTYLFKNIAIPCTKSFKKNIFKSKRIQVLEDDQDSFNYRDALVDSTHVPDIMHYIDNNRQRMSNSVSWRSRQRLNKPQNDETTPLIIPRGSENNNVN
jgi:predicted outer membrane repeat protein